MPLLLVRGRQGVAVDPRTIELASVTLLAGGRLPAAYAHTPRDPAAPPTTVSCLASMVVAPAEPSVLARSPV